MSKSSKFLGNTIILSIGTIGAKLIQYLLLPYYTNILSTAEYGTVDNLQNITTLLVPIISLTISEGVFRYALDTNYRKNVVFSNGIIINLIGAVVALVISVLMGSLVTDEELRVYIYLVVANVIVNFMRTNCSQYVKAVGSTLLYTIDSMLMTFFIVVSSIVFLSVFEMGIVGYMLGYIVGNTLSLIFLIIIGKLYKDFCYNLFSKDICKVLILFCIPLIPNTICWWISNCSDRFMITYFLGASANGIYAISYKVPTILTILVGILIQAWQISANQASEDKQIGNYYTRIYKYLDAFILCVSAGTIVLAQPLISIMAADDYFEAWRYVPSLVFAICFYSKAQLLGTIYTTFRHTTMAFVTNFVAAVINIAGNFVLIPKMGIMGAAVATAMSYVVLWLVRCLDTKKHVTIEYDMKKEILTSVVLLVEALVVVIDIRYIWIGIICAIVIVALNARILLELVSKVWGLVRNKLHG